MAVCPPHRKVIAPNRPRSLHKSASRPGRVLVAYPPSNGLTERKALGIYRRVRAETLEALPREIAKRYDFELELELEDYVHESRGRCKASRCNNAGVRSDQSWSTSPDCRAFAGSNGHGHHGDVGSALFQSSSTATAKWSESGWPLASTKRRSMLHLRALHVSVGELR